MAREIPASPASYWHYTARLLGDDEAVAAFNGHAQAGLQRNRGKKEKRPVN
jgi:hypothetical protein